MAPTTALNGGWIGAGQPGLTGLCCVAIAFERSFTLAQRGDTSLMNGFLCSAVFLLLASLAGCGSAQLFNAHLVPESATATDAPWPRLVDTPKAPAKGAYSEAVPDPAAGVAASAQLGIAADDAAARAESLRGPVLTEAERRRLTRKR
jgi:hypothetical protein